MDDITKHTIKARELRQVYLGDCSSVTLWRLRKKDSSFPKPIKVGGLLLWDRETVERWYQERLAEV